MKLPAALLCLLLLSFCSKKEESSQTIRLPSNQPQFSVFIKPSSIQNYSDSYALDTNTTLLLLSSPNNGDGIKLVKKTAAATETLFTSSLDEYASNLTMVNPLVGYFTTGQYSSALFRTSDGGKNWSQIKTFVGNIWDYKAIDENILYVLAGNLIHKSVDGGQTWTTVLTAGWPSSLQKLFFINKDIGFVLYENNGGHHNDGGTYKKTTNGGATWMDHKVPTSYHESFREIFFIDANTGYALSETDRFLYTTTNGGTDWNKSALDVFNYHGRIHMFKDGRGVITNDSSLYYTRDFGQTTKLLFDAGYGQFGKIQIIDENTLLIHHTRGVFKIKF